MEHRMSLRIPVDQPATICPGAGVGQAVSGELRDVSFDGAFLITKNEHPESLLRREVRVRVSDASVGGTASMEIPARVVRAKSDGVGLAFDAYDQTVNDFLERLYSERLTPSSTSAMRQPIGSKVGNMIP